MGKKPFRLAAGIAGIVAGCLLLLVTTGVIRSGELLVPFLLFFVGIGFLYRALSGDGRDACIFVGTFLTLSALFFILRTTVLPELTMRRVWPVFMTIGGIALLSYSRSKGSEYQLVLAVPAAAMVLLSVVFLLFSVQVIKVGFVEFILSWWPGVIVFAGIVAVWSYFSRQSESD